MRVVSLASGSGGNAYAVVSGGAALLVDCGISCRELVKRCCAAGIDPVSICAVAFTHNHNDHVNRQTFMLSADVSGIYYLTDSGQLLAAAYDLPGIHALEKDLRKSVLAPYVIATGKYEFKEPVLYEFVESNFEDFDEFIEFIQI